MSIRSEATSADGAADLREALADLIALDAVIPGRNGLMQFRGRLLRPADEVYALAARRLQHLGYALSLRRQGQDDLIYAWPKRAEARTSRLWLNALLFGLTVASVLFTGIANEGWLPGQPVLPHLPSAGAFAATLLGILLAHELGHYFAGHRCGIQLSLPFFIPLPVVAPFGTLGAMIGLREPPPNRRALLAMAAAGPLAGLAVALPLLVVGLRLSHVGPIPVGENVLLEGNSLLYAAVKYLVFGRLLPHGGIDVNLHPAAFGAWAGLLVTGLNLVPAGQLDGGHVLYVLLGKRAQRLVLPIAIGLAALGLFWPSWFLLAGLVYVFGRFHAVPLDDITPLSRWQVALAIAVLVIFGLIFTPIPMTLVLPPPA